MDEYIILRQDDRYPIPESASRKYVFTTPIRVYCTKEEAIKLAEYLCGPGMEYEYYVYHLDY
jgi:hypothetical protein